MGSKDFTRVAGGVGYFNQAMRKKMDEYKRRAGELIYRDSNIPSWQKSLITDRIERDLKEISEKLTDSGIRIMKAH
jgi:hypothetical protein